MGPKAGYQPVTTTVCSGPEVSGQNGTSLTIIWNCSYVQLKSWGREILASALREAQVEVLSDVDDRHRHRQRKRSPNLM